MLAPLDQLSFSSLAKFVASHFVTGISCSWGPSSASIRHPLPLIMGLRYGMGVRTSSSVSYVCTELLTPDLLPSTGTVAVPGETGEHTGIFGM